jgi:hypothetical protein
MPLLQRFTTPIAALLPDLNNVPQQRQAVGAIVASLVVHLILLLLFVVAAGFFPELSVEFKKGKPELQPLELEIVSMPTPESMPELITPEELKARAERMEIDSTGLAKADEAPKEALFESDQDMKAASEKPRLAMRLYPRRMGEFCRSPRSRRRTWSLDRRHFRHRRRKNRRRAIPQRPRLRFPSRSSSQSRFRLISWIHRRPKQSNHRRKRHRLLQWR